MYETCVWIPKACRCLQHSGSPKPGGVIACAGDTLTDYTKTRQTIQKQKNYTKTLNIRRRPLPNKKERKK